MTTDTRTITFLQTTDAEFRAWVADIIDQLNDIGLTQTSDTGQIDTVTVNRPGATNTQAGYAVFRFNDTQQTNAPIFIKVGFGTGAATTTPSIWITVGKNTDGAGTLSNIIRIQLQRQITAGASSIPSHACYDADLGSLWAVWGSSWTTNAVATLMVMRSCELDGTPNSGGVLTNWTQAVAAFTITNVHTLVITAVNPFALTANTSNYVGPYWEDGFPVVWVSNGYIDAAHSSRPDDQGFCIFPGLYGCLLADFAPLNEVTVELDGVDHNYMAFTVSGGVIQQLDAHGSGTRALLLWE